MTLANFLGACRDGNIEAVRVYTTRGQDMNEADEAGKTGLMWASLNNHLNIVEYLVRRGAIVNTADNHRWTALI